MKYLLDTDHISFLQRKSGREFACLVARIGQHSPDDFALSIITSIALSRNLTVLTRNVRDFSNVPNLMTEGCTLDFQVKRCVHDEFRGQLLPSDLK